MMHWLLIFAGEARTHMKNTKGICPRASGSGRMMRYANATAESVWYRCIIRKRQRSLEPLRPTIKALDLAETNQSWRTCRAKGGSCEQEAGCRCARRATSAGSLRSALTKSREGQSDVASMAMGGCCVIVGRLSQSLGAMTDRTLALQEGDLRVGFHERNSNVLEPQKQCVYA